MSRRRHSSFRTPGGSPLLHPWLGSVAACALYVVAAAALAAEPPADKRASAWEEASRYYEARDWERAAEAFGAIVKSDSTNVRAWFRLGVSQQNLKAYDRAVAAYRRAEGIAHGPVAMMGLARAFALASEPDSALAWLGRAADAGYRLPDEIRNDEALTTLRGDARYTSAVEKIQRNATPCAFSPESRQFDFWVGSWDVRTPQGDLAGTNEIRVGAGQCVLIENWKGAQGGNGQSLNFYDAASKLWRQIWVDASGGVTRFEGTFTNGAMRFTGERVSVAGDRTPVRMTFTPLPDGRVRQMGEASNDGGKTWSVEYDLYYSPARRDG